ncbi:alpha/beta fold hydrolase [Actinoalloteichus caeruleus]|uniref:Pimeloyl-ACP methyl ester carboxylesterase n=1 Tax=Actinoalloteichus caeruleus DSM 43889 TaxID=1120930 RepID=A0ABT1JNJ1_ACTCY|nr:alpha/beta hydrolase [Actinoalloteichus caeruleus]MCP2333917.1 Pimeloyl-ACP methyl ester carboxylesterase [Actinoalloteichus caeruleus DSM 43889]
MAPAPLSVTSWGTAGPRVVLVHGSGTWGAATFGFAAQRPLAADHQLVVPDRRGYGASPDTARSDPHEDATDIGELLDDGAHLVGHSSGAVVALLVTAARPDRVRSLTLIEPACFQLAPRDPVVAAAIARNRAALDAVPPTIDAEELVRLNYRSAGLPVPEITERHVRATRTALAERPAWDTPIPSEAVANAPRPTLVITGTWENAADDYREHGGRPIMACARVTADLLGAELLRVPGASHWPHQERPDLVNTALSRLWRG